MSGSRHLVMGTPREVRLPAGPSAWSLAPRMTGPPAMPGWDADQAVAVLYDARYWPFPGWPLSW